MVLHNVQFCLLAYKAKQSKPDSIRCKSDIHFWILIVFFYTRRNYTTGIKFSDTHPPEPKKEEKGSVTPFPKQRQQCQLSCRLHFHFRFPKRQNWGWGGWGVQLAKIHWKASYLQQQAIHYKYPKTQGYLNSQAI